MNVRRKLLLKKFENAGFFATVKMLVMTAKLDRLDDLKCINLPDCETVDGEISIYDTAAGIDEYLKANGQGFGTPDPRELIETELGYDDSAIYVYRSGGTIASSVTVWKHNRHTVATENIFTVPDYRGRGLAGYVLLHALKEARAKGYRKARLTVYEDDEPAISLYKRLGYKLTKTLWEMHHE